MLLRQRQKILKQNISLDSIKLAQNIFSNIKANPKRFSEDYFLQSDDLKADLFMIKVYKKGNLNLEVEEVYYVDQLINRINSFVHSNFDIFLKNLKVDELKLCFLALESLNSQSEAIEFLCCKFKAHIMFKVEQFKKNSYLTQDSMSSRIDLINYLFQNIKLIGKLLFCKELQNYDFKCFIGKSLLSLPSDLIGIIFEQLKVTLPKNTNVQVLELDSYVDNCAKVIFVINSIVNFFVNYFNFEKDDLDSLTSKKEKLLDIYHQQEKEYIKCSIDQAKQMNMYNETNKSYSIVKDTFFLFDKVLARSKSLQSTNTVVNLTKYFLSEINCFIYRNFESSNDLKSTLNAEKEIKEINNLNSIIEGLDDIKDKVFISKTNTSNNSNDALNSILPSFKNIYTKIMDEKIQKTKQFVHIRFYRFFKTNLPFNDSNSSVYESGDDDEILQEMNNGSDFIDKIVLGLKDKFKKISPILNKKSFADIQTSFVYDLFSEIFLDCILKGRFSKKGAILFEFSIRKLVNKLVLLAQAPEESDQINTINGLESIKQQLYVFTAERAGNLENLINEKPLGEWKISNSTIKNIYNIILI